MRPELPIDERAQVRAFGLWWMTHQNRTSLQVTFERADKAFEDGELTTATRQYTRLARYGDKYAQFRLGLLAIQQGRPEDAWAWFKLTTEGSESDEFEEYADMVWATLLVSQREKAEARLLSLSMEYSDFALAHQMAGIFRKQLKMATGSRVGFTEGLPLLTSAGMDTNEFYGNIRMGMNFSRDLIENYGTVTLRDFELIEPETQAERGAEQPIDQP